MASNVFVVDSAFKRTQIKVTPGKTLREVLEEACKSRRISPEGYTLKTQNNKAVDLSQPFRLSGLSAGAKLQLAPASRSPSVVAVALQLPESEGGSRLSDKFASSSSLWMVLRKYEDGVAGQANKINLTQRGVPSQSTGAGRLLYEQPCVNVMGRSLETFVDLQKTLAQLGLNGGSVLLRLSFKRSEEPLEEAMQQITNYFQGLDTTPRQDITESNASLEVQSQTSSNPEIPQDPTFTSQDQAESGVDAIDRIDSTTETLNHDTLASSIRSASNAATQQNTINGVSVYHPPSSSTPAAAARSEDEAVFEPTVDHARAHQAALQRASRNQRLLSDKEVEEQQRQRQEQLATVRSVVVRVRFPDQLIIEMTVTAAETGAQLYGRVRETLAVDNEPFELLCLSAAGQQIIPEASSTRLVQDLGFRGRVLVNFAWNAAASVVARQNPSLKPEYRSHATELKVDLPTSQADEATSTTRTAEAAPAEPEKKKPTSQAAVEAKLKKFMGFGKK